jgi:hypothetical protein
MTPDVEKRLKDEVEKASLKEVMPDLDKEQEWLRLSVRLHPMKKARTNVWRYAATIALLISLTAAGLYKIIGTEQPAASIPPVTTAPITTPQQANTTAVAVTAIPTVAPVTKHTASHRQTAKKNVAPVKEVVYNSTQCPIEMRISQVMSCPNNRPRAISSYSSIQPSQQSQLNYKEDKAIASNCSLVTKEIEIKSVATGESVLLNASSYPYTAQEVFSYITREKRGDIQAGMLSDCKKKGRKLKLDNSAGSLVIE